MGINRDVSKLYWFWQVAPNTYIPALFGHAKDDKFVQPHHSDLIYKSYAVQNILDIFGVSYDVVNCA